jgi:hypothetical protein
MRMGGFELEPWDVWADYAKQSPTMVRVELWKERYRAVDKNWPSRQLAIRIAKMAFVLQKQVPRHKRLTKEEMEKFLDF